VDLRSSKAGKKEGREGELELELGKGDVKERKECPRVELDRRR